MKQTSGPAKALAETIVKDIRRATRRHFSAEDKIRIVLEGLRGEDSIAELCRREARFYLRDVNALGGFKWSSQQGLCGWIEGTRPEPRPVFSSPGSFATCC